ncbi:3-hydroxyacyl-CoA dehydrogenase NAD-binding domain-containing protein [Thauera linaloolentis]|uniref:enoyl-CoA hydratase n=1 Tax=Thauera linaloolentis (strain DSM 12138 / JCM 21573 / CCUG 41526 / CIP 105981 / IAM 15112 / NBRC 102519 / 47Lol) TaxID=1123367 RepID=N6Z539_THAL4|nr:3-hydroxyacyl-CoA dehydrogenase NAD-binding domain-containing protein [Thauera linaloolentis]ENO89692.1 NAD-binding 3-hydroxyacyl-CoA dehydrogenase [Thauera linaloolentis 47Lol = DSM 12138]MCM8567172.1 3-hydroxyacyl-CoA dehydrogenase NAD-binding domain-containing protein [Thauera linaloolentis]
MNHPMQQDWKHWTLRREADGLAWLEIDCAGAAANTLSAEVMAEFAQALDELDRHPPGALVIASGKAAGFIAGADIEEFSRLDAPAAARALVERGWNLFNRLAAVRYPTLALIRGHCLGGGLELALACRYRLAVDEPATKLALPEVMLGIVPGWGGMLRLPEAIGPAAALDMMLTGKSVDARKAKRLGLVDDCVPLRVMASAARIVALSGATRRKLALHERILRRAMNGPLRGKVADKARKQTAAKAAREHYPAPYAIIDIWEKHQGNALAVPAGEPASLEAILASPTAKNLVRVFFLQERLKAFGKDIDFTPRRVHVVGAGVMGGDIAAVCALRGMRVTLQDQSVERIAPAIQRAMKLFERRTKGDARALRFALDRLTPDPQGHGAAHADVIIEAIFEDLEAKRSLFAGLERRARPDAVLATNTSSLRLEDIASVLQDPSRLVGIHFFNPVPQLPLVEVVRGAASDAEMLRRATGFVRAIDKLPLPVESAPGFLVNAVLGPYMLEALRCVEEGRSPETVDAALTRFGMPIGPVELVDTVGLDIALAAGKALAGEGAAPPQRLLQLVSAGKLGRKSGEGYYRWADGRAQKGEAGAFDAELVDRILAPLLAAAERCVRDGVVADAELADAGVIFGTGFAPHTGGPLHLARSLGKTRIGGAPAVAERGGEAASQEN